MLLLAWGFVVLTLSVATQGSTEADKFLTEFNRRAPQEVRNSEVADWNYQTNLTAENQAAKKSAVLAFESFLQDARTNASILSNLDEDSKDVKRQVKLIRSSGSPKDIAKQNKLTDVKLQMQEIYSASKVYDSVKHANLSLDPGLGNIMSESKSYDRLLFAWKGWRDTVGPKLRPLYKQYVELSNQGAKDNNFPDTGAYWRSFYEVNNLGELVENLWNDLKPFYQEMHAYVRNKLANNFPQVKADEPIPAHLLGNMWAQSWDNIYPMLEPFKNKSSLDVTKTMLDKNLTVEDMVNITESFFVSIGMGELPGGFREKSMVRKPVGREVVCHASAWDMFVKTEKGERDVRIKQCTEVTQDWLVTTHHELGHVYYFLYYWDLPYMYRTSANPGFHEAVGDTISLSVSTPQHLVKIGLLKDYVEDEGAVINALMKKALSSIVFLPFGYLIDQWRWGVFDGTIKPSEYNARWWDLRTKYQGIKAPVQRSESDFDPGAKFHIPNDVPYIRYFISTVLQFQFHKAACSEAGFKGPLHKCSIYGSTEAGKKFGDMLKLGKSKPWPEALEKLTGRNTMDVRPIKEYFWPLYLWLREQRCSSKYPIGWPENPGPTDDPCVVPTTLPDMTTQSSKSSKNPAPTARAWSLNAADKLMMIVLLTFASFFA